MLKSLVSLQTVFQEDRRMVGVRADVLSRGVSVHLRSESFKEVMEELNVLPCTIKQVDSGIDIYPVELTTTLEGITFYCVMDEHEFETEYRSWLYDEIKS